MKLARDVLSPRRNDGNLRGPAECALVSREKFNLVAGGGGVDAATHCFGPRPGRCVTPLFISLF